MNSQSRSRWRNGSSNLLVVSLLLAILVSIAVLIAVLISGRSIADSPFVPPKKLENEQRIKESLIVGKTYQVFAKGGITARVHDKDWGVSKVVNLAYAYDASVLRTIEHNDGHRIVELRHFERVKAVKLLSEVESLELELPVIGDPTPWIEGEILNKNPQAALVLTLLKPIVKNVLKRGVQLVIDQNAVRGWGAADSLNGKTFRVVYINGQGIQSITPVDCEITSDERTYLQNSSVLADCYLLPEVNAKPGDAWKVDASQVAGFLDPTLRAIPRGSITLRREEDFSERGKKVAKLTCNEGIVELDSSDPSRSRVGRFRPNGFLNFNLNDGFVSAGELKGAITYEEISKDHLLFEASFRTQPELIINYSCVMK